MIMDKLITLVIKRDDIILFVPKSDGVWSFPSDVVDISSPLCVSCAKVAKKYGLDICEESIFSIDIEGLAFTCNWKSGELIENGIWSDPSFIIPKPVDEVCANILNSLSYNNSSLL